MLRYPSPASAWQGALPLGNGRLGAMLYGGVARETLRLNEESVWYGGPMDRTPAGARAHLDALRQLIRAGRHADAEALVGKRFLATPKSMRHYEPLGTCVLEFMAGDGEVEGYERSLDFARAEAVVQYVVNGTRVRREAVATHADNVIALRVVADSPITFRVSLTRTSEVEWEVNEFLDSIELVDGRIVLHATPGGSVRDVGRELEVTASDALVVLAAQTQYRHSNTQQAALSDLESALQLGPELIWRRHLDDWHPLYDRMAIHLFPDNSQLLTPERLADVQNPGLAALFHAYARYLLLSSSRASPKALPANLQGIWNPSFQPPWGSKFVLNINLQMNYWAVHVSNLSECELPVFDLLERMAINGRHTASEVWGCRGWCAHHCTDIFGDTETQDRWMPASLWPLGGAWVCTLVWEHYAFNGDETLLVRMAPVLEGCVDFLLDFLVEDSTGKFLVTNPSLSPENTFLHEESQEKGVFCEGSTMDTEIVRQVFSQFLLISTVLKGRHELQERAPAVEAALSKLSPITISPNTGTIQEWGVHDFAETEPGHRHISHLYALHPGSSITPSTTPALAQAATKTLRRRLAHGGGHTGWSRSWLVNLWARLRQPAECRPNIEALLRDSTLPNLLASHPPFQIDANFGGAAGIVECLVQSHEEVQTSGQEGGVRLLRLLPACPVGWKKGSVRGVRCQGGFEVAFEWEDGRVQSPVRIDSLFGRGAVLVVHHAGSGASDEGVEVNIPAVQGVHLVDCAVSAGVGL
ncbi:Six-hairpin glycosidase-like protein [Boeremia exigua]|uniref:Six-hairpin glycosidase-like protein n=1 Tax=Boeremia exigua TaxID=749465 RepID=UPI001E8D9E4D|nr:Six-hairpin glycosidase-like protein [Boeremia exigua]KAH6643175.1 Six-hairpin glycosidase-like protein [Boeremia exigua]